MKKYIFFKRTKLTGFITLKSGIKNLFKYYININQFKNRIK
jgi:hypothetical protein